MDFAAAAFVVWEFCEVGVVEGALLLSTTAGSLKQMMKTDTEQLIIF